MKQPDLGLNLTIKRTRKSELLAQMERVVPWAELVDLIAPYYPERRANAGVTNAGGRSQI